MRFASPNTARHTGITAVATKRIRMVSTTKAVFVAICRRGMVVSNLARSMANQPHRAVVVQVSTKFNAVIPESELTV
jgi:hypothetical protein